MTRVFVIRSAATGAASVSNRIVDAMLEGLRAAGPIEVTERDLDTDPVPHINSRTLAGIGRQAPETPETAQVRAYADMLIEEVEAADVIVMGVPMYNFGIPSTLKSWFDHILRAGRTFRYTAEGPEGLVKGKRVLVASSRAGTYGDGAVVEHQESHLRVLLGFMGMTDVTVVRAEGLATGGTVDPALAEARRVAETLPLAA